MKNNCPQGSSMDDSGICQPSKSKLRSTYNPNNRMNKLKVKGIRDYNGNMETLFRDTLNTTENRRIFLEQHAGLFDHIETDKGRKK